MGAVSLHLLALILSKLDEFWMELELESSFLWVAVHAVSSVRSAVVLDLGRLVLEAVMVLPAPFQILSSAV